jgi:opacity protein-like surface antigen
MKMNFLCRFGVCGLVFLGASAAAAAGLAIGPYLLAGAGQANYSIDYSGQVVQAYAGSGSTVTGASFPTSNDTSYQIGAGYQFLPWLAAEAVYVDLGRPTATYSVLGPSTLGTNVNNATYKIYGVNVSAVASVLLADNVVLFAKAGAFASQLEYSENRSNAFGSAPSFTAPKQRQTKASFGVGAEYRATKNISVRVGWDRFQDIGETFALTDTGNGRFDHMDAYSAFVLYRL